MKKIILLILTLLLSSVFVACDKEENATTERGIFSWYSDVLDDDEFFDILHAIGITEVYQMFDIRKLDEKDIKSFVSNANKNEIDIYYLCGEIEWTYDASGKSLIEEITKAKNIEGIKGIVFDIEPYHLPESETNMVGLMDSLTMAFSNAYKACDDFTMLVCIPYYYDDMGYENVLANWAENCCDGFLVMDYCRDRENYNIEKEVEICKKANKKIINIYELQQHEEAGIDPINTYYEQGLPGVYSNYAALSKIFEYKNMKMALHEYNAVKKTYKISQIS